MRNTWMAALLALAAAGGAHAEEPVGDSIEIKGYRLGMPQSEAVDLTKPYLNEGKVFTIGGARVKTPQGVPMLSYFDGVLDSLYTTFSPVSFDAIEVAVRTRYPRLSCVDSQMVTRAGVAYPQRICKLRDSLGVATLARYSGSSSEGSLLVVSDRLVAASKAKAASNALDL